MQPNRSNFLTTTGKRQEKVGAITNRILNKPQTPSAVSPLLAEESPIPRQPFLMIASLMFISTPPLQISRAIIKTDFGQRHGQPNNNLNLECKMSISKTSILLAALIGLTAGALAAHAEDHAEHGDYEYALSDSQQECRVTNPPDKNGRGSFERCIQITMHDRYGFGTLPEPAQPERVPAGVTPWGVYRDTESASNALGDTK